MSNNNDDEDYVDVDEDEEFYLEDDTEEVKPKLRESDGPWWETAKNAVVASGQYLIIGSGFEYVMKFIDIESKRQDAEVQKKDMKGKDRTKYWYYILLSGVRGKKSTIETLIDQEILSQEKVDRIKALEKNKEYLLELPATARKELGKFIAEVKLQNDQAFIMARTGTGGQTKYVFKKLTKNKEE